VTKPCGWRARISECLTRSPKLCVPLGLTKQTVYVNLSSSQPGCQVLPVLPSSRENKTIEISAPRGDGRQRAGPNHLAGYPAVAQGPCWLTDVFDRLVLHHCSPSLHPSVPTFCPALPLPACVMVREESVAAHCAWLLYPKLPDGTILGHRFLPDRSAGPEWGDMLVWPRWYGMASPACGYGWGEVCVCVSAILVLAPPQPPPPPPPPAPSATPFRRGGKQDNKQAITQGKEQQGAGLSVSCYELISR